MRLILSVAATVLAAGAMTSTMAYAQLAKTRGYSASDLDGNRASARNFVIRCMQGKQR